MNIFSFLSLAFVLLPYPFRLLCAGSSTESPKNRNGCIPIFISNLRPFTLYRTPFAFSAQVLRRSHRKTVMDVFPSLSLTFVLLPFTVPLSPSLRRFFDGVTEKP